MGRRKRADSRRGQRVSGRLSVTPLPAPDTAGHEPNTQRALDKEWPEARIRWRTRTEEFPRGAAVPAEVEFKWSGRYDVTGQGLHGTTD